MVTNGCSRLKCRVLIWRHLPALLRSFVDYFVGVEFSIVLMFDGYSVLFGKLSIAHRVTFNYINKKRLYRAVVCSVDEKKITNRSYTACVKDQLRICETSFRPESRLVILDFFSILYCSEHLCMASLRVRHCVFFSPYCALENEQRY